MAEDLMALAARVDVLELAGRLIADPQRAQVSRAGQVALAHAAENFWGIALAAYELAGLHQRLMRILDSTVDAQEIHEIECRMNALATHIRTQVAGHAGGDIQSTNKEVSHGEG